jgi:hypothetical protein
MSAIVWAYETKEDVCFACDSLKDVTLFAYASLLLAFLCSLA